jgi:putative phage-type endonuclease
MRVIDCEQGSAQWLQARLGLITASRISDVMNYLKKGGEGADRRNYRRELAVERLTGRSIEHFVSQAMEFGTEQEPFARAAYELHSGEMVEQVGFVLHPSLDIAGASPDGLVGSDGMIEIKCPQATTYLDWLSAGTEPEQHYDQMQWNMACCEREWCDFVAYQPLYPREKRLLVVRVKRDDQRIAEIENEVTKIAGEVEAMLAAIGLPGYRAAATPEPEMTSDEMLASLMQDLDTVIP